MRALIIDDDQTFCEFLTEVLADKGIEGVWTTDSGEGYTMCCCQPFDLVISDVRMPSLLGTELAARLKRDNPHVKIILLSAFADDSHGRHLDEPWGSLAVQAFCSRPLARSDCSASRSADWQAGPITAR